VNFELDVSVMASVIEWKKLYDCKNKKGIKTPIRKSISKISKKYFNLRKNKLTI
jgi:hypothetical protein